MTTSLPDSVIELVQFQPIEDILLTLLRDGLPDVPVRSLIQRGQTVPLVLVRRISDVGFWDGDRRFIDTADFHIETVCDGANADQDAALLGEAVRVVLDRSVNTVVDGLGHLTRITCDTRPHRVPDWATATGPVQYADLPTNVVRYEATYRAALRRPV